jgi:hypothetical protein
VRRGTGNIEQQRQRPHSDRQPAHVTHRKRGDARAGARHLAHERAALRRPQPHLVRAGPHVRAHCGGTQARAHTHTHARTRVRRTLTRAPWPLDPGPAHTSKHVLPVRAKAPVPPVSCLTIRRHLRASPPHTINHHRACTQTHTHTHTHTPGINASQQQWIVLSPKRAGAAGVAPRRASPRPRAAAARRRTSRARGRRSATPPGPRWPRRWGSSACRARRACRRRSRSARPWRSQRGTRRRRGSRRRACSSVHACAAAARAHHRRASMN